mmetsp:Transcript_51368/g.130675  ORF Transcript_51368/g.130675 Transcript_51368/m.130675 type:complete len:259 (-) Transcript_51368:445-1221(-)
MCLLRLADLAPALFLLCACSGGLLPLVLEGPELLALVFQDNLLRRGFGGEPRALRLGLFRLGLLLLVPLTLLGLPLLVPILPLGHQALQLCFPVIDLLLLRARRNLQMFELRSVLLGLLLLVFPELLLLLVVHFCGSIPLLLQLVQLFPLVLKLVLVRFGVSCQASLLNGEPLGLNLLLLVALLALQRLLLQQGLAFRRQQLQLLPVSRLLCVHLKALLLLPLGELFFVCLQCRQLLPPSLQLLFLEVRRAPQGIAFL